MRGLWDVFLRTVWILLCGLYAHLHAFSREFGRWGYVFGWISQVYFLAKWQSEFLEMLDFAIPLRLPPDMMLSVPTLAPATSPPLLSPRLSSHTVSN